MQDYQNLLGFERKREKIIKRFSGTESCQSLDLKTGMRLAAKNMEEDAEIRVI